MRGSKEEVQGETVQMDTAMADAITLYLYQEAVDYKQKYKEGEVVLKCERGAGGGGAEM
jgi:hypothetical protein